MQARVSGPSPHQLYAPSTATPPKGSLNWNLDDWKWDGDLFLATPTLNMDIVPPDGQQLFPLAPPPPPRGGGGGDSSNASTSCSDEATFLDNNNNNKGKGVCDKRRRLIVLDVEDVVADEAASLTLKLGGHHPSVTTAAALSPRVGGVEHPPPRALCQVQNCGADLTNAKDYHRRHKVCAMHAKASNAMVGNVVQRFCQQCSRFHLLQEFDEGKRSCRRRLAGHNRRRRKTQPDANIRENALADDRTSNYLLITLLKILSALNSGSPAKANDHDLISHLLKSLSGVSGASDGSQLPGFLPAIQEKKIGGASFGEARQDLFRTVSNGTNHVVTNEETSQPFPSSSELKNGNSSVSPLMYPAGQSEPVTVATLAAASNERIVQNGCGKVFNNDDAMNSITTLPLKEANAAKAETNGHEKIREWSIDLNNICNETEDFLDGSVNHANGQIVSGECPQWPLQDSHQLSPPQISGNSDSASAQSLSSSNGDTQSRTDRIVFKLFGKDPSHFPLGLRSQIFEWLSNSPTDIESYIRPGCIILTLYLRLSESAWEELCGNLSLSLKKLLELSSDSFWQSGWIYARIHQQIAVTYDGHVVLDTGLGVNGHRQCCITSITPIAVTFCEQVNFIVKGINLSTPSTRLLCAFEGAYIFLESTLDSDESSTFHEEWEETQVIGFSCSLPSVVGRGFIEVEDHGLSCSFFPFIVADGDMVSEMRSLESVIDTEGHDHKTDSVLSESKLRNDAINFLHEMGWLLKRSHLVSRLGQADFGSNVFCLGRFKWLLEFSMDHDWCAVVKKLLDVLFEGTVDMEGHPSREMLLEMGLLHRAVRRNCRAMVEFLLRYVPTRKLDEHEADADLAKHADGYLFRPDMPGPAGMTPLHIAASRDNAEMVLDALTDDPGQVGVGAWKVANDNSGFAPQDYARLRGYFSYIHLVQRKIRRSSVPGHCILDIPGSIPSQPGPFGSGKLAGFEIEKSKLAAIGPYCKGCAQQQLAYSSVNPRSLVYRPAMLSLVVIAAVCVCVALLFKGPPEVVFVFPPFRWERLCYGVL